MRRSELQPLSWIQKTEGKTATVPNPGAKKGRIRLEETWGPTFLKEARPPLASKKPRVECNRAPTCLQNGVSAP